MPKSRIKPKRILLPARRKDEYPSELRLGSLNNRWVLIARGRAMRPRDWAATFSSEPTFDPFDPANVHPEEITDVIRNTDNTPYSIKSDWKAIALKNVYPLVAIGGSPRLRGETRDGYGYHELIVHSPDRNKDFEDFTPAQTQAVLELYLKRYNHLTHKPHIKHVQIFTNRGEAAGASLGHPHSQIIALPIIPPYVEQLARAARQHHRAVDRSVSEDEILQESHNPVRVVYEDSKFLVYCPFAPHADYHIRIMPKQEGAHFHEITQDQVEHLAHVLNLALRRLRRITSSSPYNAFIRTAPFSVKDLEGFRWHIDILPHLSTPGGLELSTGLDVVTVTPEDAAHALRQGD